MRTAAVFAAGLAALPLAFVVIRVVDPLIPYAWRTGWRFMAVVGIPALVCGLTYAWTVGPPRPPPERCPHCGTPVDDPSEPNCLECGRPRASG
ncbi:MAG: hypothetical protein V2A79_03860 [Planctomycetota bacterium]